MTPKHNAHDFFPIVDAKTKFCFGSIYMKSMTLC